MDFTDSSFVDHLLQPVDTMWPGGKAEFQPLTSPLSDQLESQYPEPSNSAPSYPYNFENIPHMLPHSQTTFSSSESRQKLIDPYGRGPYGPTFHGQEPYQRAFQGQQIQGINQYDNSMYIPAQNGPSIYPAWQQFYPNPPYPAIPSPTPAASSPPYSAIPSPTPAASNPSSGKKGIKKKQTPRKASKRKQAIDKSKIPKLTAPLSELTDFDHVPLKDVLAYCTRPKEIRVTEKGKSGKISRPMNSYMLYRYAYSERCKVWCAQNNHQIVSTICGQSWVLETPEIKERFADFSQVEKINFAKAHPGYKYRPAKPAIIAGPKRRKTAPETEDEEDPSDVDDTDYIN
ncbi:hypothetical protein MMC22_006650 [Lobaria immixta]|nr:hypothetical protein [Lobaria immixta]